MIRAERLVKRYGAVVALDGLSFEVERGETLAIIGPNGAGKTTTLKTVLGLVRPDSGRVTIGPERIAPTQARARAALGYVPQRVEFPPGRTVGEVLAFFAALRGLPAGAVEIALGRVDLLGMAARRASELSGGYSQRLSLAQALLGDPGLLVLDEPTASLDPEATWEFRALVERLRREGKTVLFCSHLLAEVERIADRVLILVGGRCAGLERVAELRERQMHATRLVVELAARDERASAALAARGFRCAFTGPSTLVFEGADGRGAEALETLRAQGAAVRSFEVQRPTLEDVFLEVVKRGRGHE